MLGIGWGEMLVIAIIALVVVGPKDLPGMLRNLGRMMGSVRRMSDEFRRELDKAIAVEEFKEAQKAISDPLNQTTADIRKEFNLITKDGKVEPSGKIKPSEPGKESVVDEIRAQAGIAPDSASRERVAASMKAQVQARTKAMEAEQPVAEPAKKPAAKKAGPASDESSMPAKAAAKAPKPKAPAKKKAAKPADDSGES